MLRQRYGAMTQHIGSALINITAGAEKLNFRGEMYADENSPGFLGRRNGGLSERIENRTLNLTGRGTRYAHSLTHWCPRGPGLVAAIIVLIIIARR